jgi:glycosyltransferase involved in cell wall biosynthesis
MSPLRLVLVTGRFWPLADDQPRLLAELADQLVEQGASVTVVTAQCHKSWPARALLRRTPVFRLNRPATRVWGTFRYLRALSNWLWERREQTDLVYVCGLREEAYAALGTLGGSGLPVVLRAEGVGRGGDCHWQKTAAFGSRVAGRCRKADALVVSSDLAADELRAARYPPERIELIPDGVPARGPRSAEDRRTAREALADVHPILAVAEDAPLVLYAGPIRENLGLFDLVAAWSDVVRRWPQARLWLAGDATGADALWSDIQQSGLSDTIIFPGAFDLLDDVLPAADLFVLPTREPLDSLALIEAMAAGVPVVASATAGTQRLAASDCAALTPAGDADDLAATICRLLADKPAAGRLAAAASQLASRQHRIEQTTQAHLALFRRLVSARSLALS